MHDLTKLKSIIAEGESESVEFKTSFNDEALETIGAFANANGGSLLIGVNDSGNIVGLQLGKKTIEDFANRIQTATDPRIQPSIEIASLNNSHVVIINVSSNSNIPISVRGKYYKRVGKTNQRMSHNEIMKKMLDSARNTWDGYAEEGANLADLSEQLIEDFKAKLKENGFKGDLNISIPALLSKFEYLNEGLLSRASILLFTESPTKYYPSAYAKIGRFRTPTTIVADREIRGSLLEQLDSIMTWFSEHLSTEYVITGKPVRDVIWEYPIPAIREATINLLLHRDYLNGTHSQIRLFDDRLEFWNSGNLPEGLSPEDLLTIHNSYPRNKNIANAFFLMGLVEKWGSGTLRISRELKAAGLPPPEFVSNHSGFKVIFRKNESAILPENINLTTRQEKILSLIKEQALSANDIAKQLSISVRTIHSELNKLKATGYATQTGKGRATKWHAS